MQLLLIALTQPVLLGFSGEDLYDAGYDDGVSVGYTSAHPCFETGPLGPD
jgi:hypothetical protein